MKEYIVRKDKQLAKEIVHWMSAAVAAMVGDQDGDLHILSRENVFDRLHSGRIRILKAEPTL